jgi:hypothetical protein
MKTLISILSLAIFGLFFQGSTYAQGDDTEYVIVEYMKVKPGMGNKYLECEKAWKLIHQERIKLGHITGWELERVISPSGIHSEYDYLTITHLKNWQAIEDMRNSWNEATWNKITVNLTPEQKKVADEANLYRDFVKSEIWAAADMVFGNGSTPPKYRVENFMRIPAGGWDDWMEMETRFVKPVHQKSVEMGTRAGWVITYMVLPRGDDYPYQASTIDFYDTWADMNKSEEKAWNAVYPDMSDGHVNRRINSTRTLAKTEVRMLVDYAQ